MQSGFEHAQVRQHGQIGNAKLSRQRGLKVNPHKGHKVLHATRLIFLFFFRKIFDSNPIID
jgi:hypothetical protein